MGERELVSMGERELVSMGESEKGLERDEQCAWREDFETGEVRGERKSLGLTGLGSCLSF